MLLLVKSAIESPINVGPADLEITQNKQTEYILNSFLVVSNIHTFIQLVIFCEQSFGKTLENLRVSYKFNKLFNPTNICKKLRLIYLSHRLK